MDDDLTPTEVVIDGEVEREDEDEMKRRRERSGEIVKEMSDLVNYLTPYHFKVSYQSTLCCRCRLLAGSHTCTSYLLSGCRGLKSRGRTTAATTCPVLAKRRPHALSLVFPRCVLLF